MNKSGTIILIPVLLVCGYLILQRDNKPVDITPPPTHKELTLGEFVEKYPDFEVKTEGGVIYAVSNVNNNKVSIYDTRSSLGEGWGIGVFNGESHSLRSPSGDKIVYIMEKYFPGDSTRSSTISSRIYAYNIENNTTSLLTKSEEKIKVFWSLSRWDQSSITVNTFDIESGYYKGKLILSPDGSVIGNIPNENVTE